ncbi:MAG: hypothetical protein CMP67_03620 [Flavobacteriales bacterium]|nr:hypothetical protein [Flavobacteriales bacterium]
MEKDFEYYLKNKKELKQKFGGSFLIIQNQNILNSLPSFKEAVHYLSSKQGDFLIQEINEEVDSQTTVLSL